MSARCQITGAEPGFGHSISHSHVRSKRRRTPNIQRRRFSELILPTRINFLGDPVASGKAAQVEIVARITGAPGQPVRFPTYQRCASGNGYSWTDTAPGAEYPAPEIIATAAILTPSAVPAQSGADRGEVLIGIAVLAVVLGAAGAVAGYARGGKIRVLKPQKTPRSRVADAPTRSPTFPDTGSSSRRRPQ